MPEHKPKRERAREEYRAEKAEKQDEKQEKEEKGREEKWRRDPVARVTWAAILIWAGVVLLGEHTGFAKSWPMWAPWAYGFLGAGAIILLQAVVRLAIPEYRWGVTGNFIFGLILLGVGIGFITDWGWGVIWATVLIAVGLAILFGGLKRGRR
ncbi:MAG: hypothetical protein FJZ93_10050 [Chloroflexi bacterium]|nr:hypothetical protein [Chloroflexota bacterium]